MELLKNKGRNMSLVRTEKKEISQIVLDFIFDRRVPLIFKHQLSEDWTFIYTDDCGILFSKKSVLGYHYDISGAETVIYNTKNNANILFQNGLSEPVYQKFPALANPRLHVFGG